MVNITKSSLEQLARQMNVLAEQEQKSFVGGFTSKYSRLGTSWEDQEAQGLFAPIRWSFPRRV